MYLKRIEMTGFKSFADRTVLELQKGLTAIVGPNGSGKSNIVEAIRWTLGEPNARELRSEKMTDVIFSGSKQRRAKSFAQVQLVFAEEDQPEEEIVIARSVQRNGESRYEMNQQNCRRKDIQHFFQQHGMGRESLSIISQGKIEEILDEKPMQRRKIIEEVAGIRHYQEEQKKAEQKLKETDQHLERLEDILYELEKQRAPLEKAATKAQSAKEWQEQKESLEKELLAWKVQTTKKDLDQLTKQGQKEVRAFQELEEKLSVIQKNQAQKEAQYQQAKFDQEVQQQEFQQFQQQWNQWQTSYEVEKERTKQQLARKEEYEVQKEEIATQLEANLAKEKAQMKDYQQQKECLAEQETKEKELRNQLTKEKEKSQALKEDQQEQYFALLQEKTKWQNQLQEIEKEAQKAEFQKEKREEQKKLYRDSLQQLEKEAKKQATQQKIWKEELQSYKENQVQFLKEKEAQQQQQKEWRQQLAYWEKEKVKNTTALESMQKVYQEQTSYHQGVRAVLSQDWEGVYGVVGQLAEVDPMYQTALEVALGAQTQHIVVENETIAKKAIQFLYEKKKGRATFIPLNIIRPRQFPKKEYEKIASMDGFIGLASELLQFIPKYEVLSSYLVGQIVIAKDWDHALLIAKTLRYQYKVVTCKGEIVQTGGALTGGRQRKEAHLLAEKNQMKAYKEAIQQAEEKLLEYQRLQEKGQKLAEEKAQVMQENEANLRQVQFFLTEEERQKERREKEIQEIKTELYLLEKETTQQIDWQKEAKEAKEKIQQLEQEVQQCLQSIERQKVEWEKVQETLQKAQEKWNQQQLLVAQYRQEIKQKEKDLQQQEEQITRLHQQQALWEQRLQELSFAKKTETEWQKEKVAYEEQNQVWQEKIQQQKTIIVTLEKDCHQLLQTYQELQLQQQNEDFALGKRVEEKKVMEEELQTVLSYIQKQYQCSAEVVQQKWKQPHDIKEAKEKYEALQRSLVQLGSVDVEAYDHFLEVEERYQFMTEQKNDLVTAKEQLLETMHLLEEEMKHKFIVTFEKVNAKFQELFPKMFHGGRAQLILTEPTQPLETGLDLLVEPKGKKEKHLRLLSGGERALTAITLLLATIQVRPVPFCVLDEVEAALDEANVRRFALYLQNFCQEEQFLMITHRKGTMEVAQDLYGISMNQEGCSQVLSVRLGEKNETMHHD